MDVVPVADQSENQQQKRYKKQTGSFRRVDRVTVMLGRGVSLGLGRRHADLGRGHANIVALR